MAVSVEMLELTKRFGVVRAMDRVTLRVEPGELFFLLGPSGCGKTTLLRCVAGFCRPDSGDVRLDGHSIGDLPPHRRDTGMVFQSYALWPHLTVARNVAFGLETRGVPRAETARRVTAALDLVRMADHANRKPNELSGGQQQRVALARALVIRPRCLLLDEPLSNLDAKLRLDMRGEIRRICKEAGLTALYVTHDQKEALSIADRLAVMREGRVEQVGAPFEVYRRPRNRFVAGFIGEANLLRATVRSATRDEARLQTAIGPLLSRALPDPLPAPGAEVELCLRPETVRLGTPPAEAPNALQGRLHDTVYLGELAQHRLTLAPPEGGGEAVTLNVFETNPALVARDGAADVRAWIAPEDVVILP